MQGQQIAGNQEPCCHQTLSNLCPDEPMVARLNASDRRLHQEKLIPKEQDTSYLSLKNKLKYGEDIRKEYRAVNCKVYII